jgi:peroxiredoxin Q/BCP
MAAEGQPAPAFELADQDGKTHRLADYHGKPLVLYFYPKDDTPGCTKEACAFRDARAAYQKAGAHVVGVSPDTSQSHKKLDTSRRTPPIFSGCKPF